MKIAVIYIFLTIARVKKKEACTNHQPDRSESSNRLTVPIELDERGGQPSVSKLPWTSPFAKALRAKPYDIKETKLRWWKDHEFLVPPSDESEEFPTMRKRAEILALRTEVDELVKPDNECKETINFKKYYKKKFSTKLNTDNAWDMFFATITNCHMYPEHSDAAIQNLLGNMSTLQVYNVENFGGGNADGTQIKLKLTFENKKQALFKPMKFDHNYETDPNEFFFNEMERPNAEIAAFYLDKLLRFRRGVPTVGREFDFDNDILKKTPSQNRDAIKFYESPKTNLCMIGTCHQFCDTAHAICAVDGKIRGSLQLWLPKELYIDYDYSPYKRNYTFTFKAPWQGDHADYCENDVKHRLKFKKGRRLLDLVDLSIFDFLTGNQDRHGYEWFSDLDQFTKDTEGAFVIPLDSGRAFGTPHLDDLDILAPLTQCCIVRPSTVMNLLDFYEGPVSLGEKLEETLKNLNDPLRPILARKYLIAIDRRVEIVLQAVVDCLQDAEGPAEVLIYKLNPNRARQPRRKRFAGLKIQKQPVSEQFESQMAHNSMLRHKRNVEVTRPEIDNDLVNALDTTLKQFSMKELDPCPDEVALNRIQSIDSTPIGWKEFYAEMTNCHLYKKHSTIVPAVFKKMHESVISRVYGKGEKQLKATLQFQTDEYAIFTPMRFGREYETNPNHFYFDDFDRHHAEIAAFHLDRLLGFRRVPPTIGRWLNITTDFIDKMLQKNVRRFVSPVGNDCFHGGCHQYCDPRHAFCGVGNRIQGSVRLMTLIFKKVPKESPYKKIYSEREYKITSKRTEKSYCDQLKRTEPYDKGRRLLDLVDLHIFDFLTGNQERDGFHLLGLPYTHHEPYIFVTENGKAFGNPHDDDLTILAPLTQCCVVRPSTVRTLVDFYEADDSLGKQLDDSLKDDPLYPILAEKYLSAINRRVEIVLQQVEICLKNAEADGGDKTVLMNKFFRKSNMRVQRNE